MAIHGAGASQPKQRSIAVSPFTAERHESLAPTAQPDGDRVDPLHLVATIVRHLRSERDVMLGIEQALHMAHRALSLSSTQILYVEDASTRAVLTVGWTPEPMHEEMAACRRELIAVAPFQTIRTVNQALWALLAGSADTRWLLSCRRESGASFGESEIQTISILCSIFAGYLDQLRLIGELRDAEEDALHALATSLASRDRYTGAHVDAVCTYAERLGQRLGLDVHALRVLRMGSILHDIGKIGVNDAILQKNGPLTAAEMMQMRQHTIIGAQIVRQVRRLQPALPIILYHHERWDGTGYPSGLCGEQIPFAARIVAVVDSFHAMTSSRPYRSARSHAEAIAELRRGSGSHFDPSVLAAFIELMDEAGTAPASRAP